MVAVIAILCLISSPSAAQMASATVSANVIAAPASMSQADDGTITTSGQPPLYCETDSTGTMCYY